MTPDDMKELAGVVRYAARKAGGSQLEFDDAAQIAWLAIVESWDAYDPSKASRKTYAQRMAVGAVLDAANGMSSSLSVPARAMKRYRAAIRAHGSADAAFEHAQDFDMSPRAFAAVHMAVAGVSSLDAERLVSDMYEGTEEHNDAIEYAVADEWASDLLVTVWEAIDGLTDRQRDVLMLWSRGLSTVEIGKRLGIAQRVAHRHLENGIVKLRDFYSLQGLNIGDLA